MQRPTILALSILSLGLLPLACTQNFNFFASSQGTGGAGASGSTTTTSTTTSTSGTGGSDGGPSCMGAMACTSPAECGTPPNSCTSNTCIGGCCGTEFIASETACHSGGGTVCDGMGNCVPCVMPSDCPDTGTVCAVPTCNTNTCGDMLASQGTTCADNGGTVCDGKGKCVSASCSDGIQDGNETDVDCGGSCSPCADGKHCKKGADCVDKVCTGDVCQAPTCSDGVQNGMETGVDCGGATCDGEGKTCGLGQGCGGNADCANDNCQNNVCAPLPDGSTCTMDNECKDAHCVSGICCNNACAGTCQACTAALTGGTDGTCASISAGTQAPTGCTAAECGNTGTCDGTGACTQVASGTACGTASCTNGTATAQGSCGGGTCNAGATMSCAPYTCGGTTCRTTCTNSGQCATGDICTGGHCGTPLTNGTACANGAQCESTFCVDGVCCGTACNGTCQACTAAKQNAGGTDGTCADALNGTDPHGTCPAQNPLVCGDVGASCTAGACTEVASGATCGGTCTNGSATAAGTCNGTGTCSGTVTSCGNYNCNGTACGTTCTTSANCATGHTCNGGGMCI